MKFILTEEELRTLQRTAEETGFQKATILLSSVLKGDRDLMVQVDGNSKSIMEPGFEDNVWRKLVEALDSNSKKEEVEISPI